MEGCRRAWSTAVSRPLRSVLVVGVLASSLTFFGASPAGAAGETLATVLTQVDGTPAWNADDAAGHDSTGTNGIVRTNDNLTYNVEVSVTGGSAQNTTFTVALAQGTEMSQVPALCTGPGSSLTPATLPAPVVPVTATSWTSLPSQTLVCNVGTRSAGSTLTYPIIAKVRPEVPNGTDLTPVSASVVTDSVTTPVVSNTVDAKVSARAQFDISKNGTAADPSQENLGYLGGGQITSCPDPLGAPGATRQCFEYATHILVSGPAGGKGIAPMSGFSFTDDLTGGAFYGSAVTSSPAWAAAGSSAAAKYGPVLLACSDGNHGARPGSGIGQSPAWTAATSVRDSGQTTCSQPGGPGTLVDVQVVDLDGTAYTSPITDGAAPFASLPADRSFVYASTLTFAIPVDAVVDLGVAAGSGTQWTLPWSNTYTGFAGSGIDGIPNDPAANPSWNDHRDGTSTVGSAGSFSKSFVGVPGAVGNTAPVDFTGTGAFEGPPGSNGPDSGQGQLLPGQTTISDLFMANYSTLDTPLTYLACDTWDRTLLNLTSRTQPGGGLIPGGSTYWQRIGSAGEPVWVAGYEHGVLATTAADLPDLHFQVQYGTGAGGSGDSSTCGDADSPGGWFSNPADVPGNDALLASQGVYTAVSRVRVLATLPSPGSIGPVYLNVGVGLRAVDGLPVGTVLPNWANVLQGIGVKTQDELLASGAWSQNDYDPAANTGDQGDRLLIAVAAARIRKQVKDPGTGAFGSTVPQFSGGQLAEFQLQPTLTSGIGVDASTPVTVEDCLPVGEIFQAATSDPPASVAAPSAPPAAELTCASGETYVRWDLGPQPINRPIPQITYSVRIANTATSGIKTNVAAVSAEGDTSALAQRKAAASIQIVQPAGIKIDKIALTPLVELNRTGEASPDPLQWRVDLANLDTDPGPTNIDVIDVLPKQGLNGSSFTGSLSFDSAAVVNGNLPGQAVEILYTNAASVNDDAFAASNDAATGITWCSLSGTTFNKVLGAGTSADCPTNAAAVTGLRVRRPGTFGPSDLVSFTVDMIPKGNRADDIYVNDASGRATGLELIVGPVAAPETVIASSVGDYVWDDANLNGIQDAGEAPISGFTVTLSGTDTDGNAVGPLTTTTDADGKYLFTGLQSGEYTVTFDPASLGPDQHFTLQDQGGNDATDSDGDPATGVASVTLTANATDLTVDQGVFTALPDIEVTKYINGEDANTAPGVLVEPGADMIVTFDVHNNGNMALDPVVLTDDTIDAADITCPKTALAIDETMTCTATYPGPAAGVQHTNVASVEGTPVPLPDGTQLPNVTDNDPANAFGRVRNVTITKDLVGEPVPNGDGTYTITYDIVVTNKGTQTATYDLDDQLHFGAGAAVTAASVSSGPAGVTLNPAWDGAGTTRIASAVDIPVDGVHTYRVKATASIDTAVGTTASSDCDLTQSETGTGFLNGATLTFNGETTDVDACATFPLTTIEKKLVGAPVANGDGTTTINYDIVVSNQGTAADRYDLSDQLHFGGDVSVQSATVTNTAPGSITTSSSWDGGADPVIVTGQAIGAGASHTYRVSVVARVATTITLEQSDCTLQTGETGTGFLNGATLSVNGIDTQDDACAPAPNTTMTKELIGAPVVEDDNTVTVTYAITVRNTGAGDDVYDLQDELQFGADITVNNATVANTTPGTITTNGAWNGASDTNVVTGQTIASGGTHIFVVTVNATVGTKTTVTQADCTIDTGETGTGFLNNAVLSVGGHKVEDDACGTVDPKIVVHKKLIGSPTANGDGTWTIDYQVEATNIGPVPGTYDLSDKLAFGQNVSVVEASVTNTSPGTVVTNPNWDGINDVGIVNGEPLGVGTTHTYKVTAVASVAPGLTTTASDCDITGDETGTGFLNTAELTYKGGTSDDHACAAVPNFTIVKTIKGTPSVTATGAVDVTYTLTVTNTGRGAGAYDLNDKIRWGDGLTVTGAEVSVAPTGAQAKPNWNGTTETLIAEKVKLTAGGRHVWEVHVTGQRSNTMTVKAGDCTVDAGETGTGLLNTATVESNGQTADSSACGRVVPPTEPTKVEHRTGSLPYTGSELTGLVLSGLALVGGGFMFLGISRRRRSGGAQ